MAIDAELATFLAVPFPNDIDDVLMTRRLTTVLTESEIADREPLAPGLSWHDHVIDEFEYESSVPIRIYCNENAPSSSGALLFFHGGAFVFGGLESEHARCVNYAQRAECVVVSVDYRLAPEHPYPAAHDDGVTALDWLRRNASSLGVDPKRIAVGGSSAGGALAAGLVLRTRDFDGEWIRAQLLIYPAIDSEAATPSIEQFYKSEPWDGERTLKMWKLYLADSSEKVSPYASPARASDLTKLPPTYIMTAEEDPLRDEGINYAERLLAAGNALELHHFARTFHGFDVVAPGSRISDRAHEDQAAFLRRELTES
jgi:acetyl esterase